MFKGREKELDLALERAFRDNYEFAAWFLGKTRFAGRKATCVWSRSNYPWIRLPLEVADPVTGKITRDSETDVRVVFKTDDERRFALHIENKGASGSFTPHQVEDYPRRARAWVQDYLEWETVLAQKQASAPSPQAARAAQRWSRQRT